MADSPRRYRIEYLPSPQLMCGWKVDFVAVGYAHGVTTPQPQIGLFLKPRAASADETQLLFLSPDDALLLRDALSEAFAIRAARESEAN